jgi:predicted dehydrogenase
MRIGFIGAGRMTQRRLVSLPNGCKPVAVYDRPGKRVTEPDRKRLEDLHVKSPNDVIEAADIVVITTPNAFLADYAHAAVVAGKHVLVEKPAAINAAELERVRAATPRGVVVRVGYNHRFWPGIAAARAHVTSPVLHIRAAYGHGGRPSYEREWRLDPRLSGGGELIDQGSHLIDLTRWFATSPELHEAMLTSEFWAGTVEDNAYLALDLGSGLAWLHASWTEWGSVFRWEAVTATTKVEVTGFPWEQQLLRVVDRAGEVTEDSWVEDQSLTLEMTDMLKQIAGGEPVGATINDGIAALDLIDAAYARRGARW